MTQPHPWQSAQLEIGGLPLHFAWQNLRLYTGIYAQIPTPLYLKRKTARELVLHADWPAAEPGFHHLRIHDVTISHAQPLWQNSFFIEAPPLTQALWLEMLRATYQQAHLRFQSRAPIALQSVQAPKRVTTIPTEPMDPMIELARLQWLLSPAGKLSESLALLTNEHTWQVQPLYRTRKTDPALLYQNIKALPLHTPVRQRQWQIPQPIAGMIHFLMLALDQRYQWLNYMVPQLSKETTHLPQTLQQLAQHRALLWRQWQNHPYQKSNPHWDSDSFKHLSNACHPHRQLKPWVSCARLLQTPLEPGLLTAPPLLTGYIGFGYVYQYWCTQHLHQALHEHLQSAGWVALPQSPLPTQKPQMHWQSPNGARLVLETERRYAPNRNALPQASLYSISRGQQPDLSLLYFESSTHWKQQQAKRGLVFEIKFRQDAYGRPRKVDLDRLHAYRDAVYVHRPHHRLFVGGALLYPGRNERYTPGLEALNCLPKQELRLEYLLNHLLEKPPNP